MPTYLGVDPGANGALCFLDSRTRVTKFLPTPRGDFSPMALRQAIKAQRTVSLIRCAAVEKVHAMSLVSAGSTFNFGYNYGVLMGVLQTLDLEIDLVTPRTWQKSCQIPTRKELGGSKQLKEYVARLAHDLYPTASLYGPRGGLMDGRSDALMIAHWLKKTMEY